jgi:hypothetical protein
VGTLKVPAVSTLSKIGTLDFLAVLPSGVFTFLVTYMVLSGDTLSGGEPSLWLQLERMVTDTLGNPLILLCVLFVSYFFGSILRAFPVEWLVATLHVGRRRCPRRRATDMSNGAGRRLKFRVGHGMPLSPRKSDVIPRSIINDWKHALSHRSPEAYAYFRTVEAKSRFAAAMLWAGVLGVVGSVAYIAVFGSNVALTQLALVSILLALTFGSLLPKVCRQEVSALLTLSEATRQSARH